MKILYTLTLLLICNCSFAQDKILYNAFSSNGDSTYWFKYVTTIANKLSLPKLINTSNNYYLRIWSSNQVIEIWEKQNDSIFGKLTSWVDECRYKNEIPTNRSYFTSIALNSTIANSIKKMYLSENILRINSGDSIKGWSQGFDGIEYLFEYSTLNYYSLKSYWTPESQRAIPEAINIGSFLNNAFSLADSKSAWAKFQKTIPYECYNTGILNAIKVTTKREKRAYRRERDNYRQH